VNKPISLRPAAAPPTLLRSFADPSRRKWIAALCLLCGLAIVLQSWTGRFSMNPDGISYLDMADKLLRGDFSPLAHPYWSPLYPVLLAFALKLFHPLPALEFPVVHVANCLIGLAALASFTFFLSQYLRVHGIAKRVEPVISFRCRTALAYALFLWGTVEANSLASVSPDLLVSTFVYLVYAAGYWQASLEGPSPVSFSALCSDWPPLPRRPWRLSGRHYLSFWPYPGCLLQPVDYPLLLPPCASS
jgi:hypothetical protein